MCNIIYQLGWHVYVYVYITNVYIHIFCLFICWYTYACMYICIHIFIYIYIYIYKNTYIYNIIYVYIHRYIGIHDLFHCIHQFSQVCFEYPLNILWFKPARFVSEFPWTVEYLWGKKDVCLQTSPEKHVKQNKTKVYLYSQCVHASSYAARCIPKDALQLQTISSTSAFWWHASDQTPGSTELHPCSNH